MSTPTDQIDQIDPIERSINAAHETASECRAFAAILKQTKMFPDYVDWLNQNARAAERWAMLYLPYPLPQAMIGGTHERL